MMAQVVGVLVACRRLRVSPFLCHPQQKLFSMAHTGYLLTRRPHALQLRGKAPHHHHRQQDPNARSRPHSSLAGTGRSLQSGAASSQHQGMNSSQDPAPLRPVLISLITEAASPIARQESQRHGLFRQMCPAQRQARRQREEMAGD